MLSIEILLTVFSSLSVSTALSSSTKAHKWSATSTYTPFVPSGAAPSIMHPPYNVPAATPTPTTRVVTVVETVATGSTASVATPTKSSSSGHYYTTTIAHVEYGAVTLSGTPPFPPTFKSSLSLTYNPAAVISNTISPAASPSTNPLASLDPNRPTKGLVFAIQRYADPNCGRPVGPRFAYDGSQDHSCFFSHGSCRGSCGYLKLENGEEVWKHEKQTLSMKRLEQYDFGSWDYKLVEWDDVWNKKNKWQPAFNHYRHSHKKYMFPEANNEGTIVCDATFWQQRDCKENSQRLESGQVMRWQPTHLRVDEGKCMNGFKNTRGVPALAASFRIKCYA